jgi:hypothetical protein
MSRQMVWIEQQRFAGWGCSECSWLFHMPDFPKGPSLEEMKQRVEEQRDQSLPATFAPLTPNLRPQHDRHLGLFLSRFTWARIFQADGQKLLWSSGPRTKRRPER